MEPWSLLDTLVFIVGSGFVVLWQEGPIVLALLLAGAVPYFGIRLPVKAFWTYCVLSWDQRNAFTRRAGSFEFCAVAGMRWCLANLNGESIGKRIFGKPLWVWLYNYRRFRYGTEDLGDAYYEDEKTDLYSGYWVRSRSRGRNHDILLFYVPGNAFGFTSGYFYLEFVTLLLVNLQQKGFDNPGIFVVNVDYRSAPLKSGIAQVFAAWEAIGSDYQATTKLMLGSGLGAMNVLTALIHRSNPLREFPTLAAETPQPDAVVLLSPMAKLAKARNNSTSDYVRSRDLDNLVAKVLDVDDSAKLYSMPGMLEGHDWWEKALPRLGLAIMYGRDETLAGEIEQLYVNLRRFGSVVLHGEADRVHAWPISAVYTGRTKVARNAGVNALSSLIARMALWHVYSQQRSQHSP